MTTPPKQTKLWENIDWKNKDEKLAFFNHYFKNSDMVSNHVKNKLKEFKQGLVQLIEYGKIGPGKEERKITIQDIIKEIGK